VAGKTKCVIYDCDGVLFDSLEANRRFYNRVCTAVGRGPLTDEELKFCHSSTVAGAFQFLFRNHDGMEKEALAYLKEVDPTEFIAYLKIEPHLIETLEALKQRDIRRAISTNRTTTMKHIVKRFGLGPYFDMVVTAMDVKNPKPHPESIEKILKELRLDRQDVVFVGDSDVDRKTADAAGIPFIAYKNREIARDLFMEDHLRLLDLLA
jgi:HAD superfamily hydrolase (TIGR01509 family)